MTITFAIRAINIQVVSRISVIHLHLCIYNRPTDEYGEYLERSVVPLSCGYFRS